ncbi:MAG: hypothetical protein ACOCUV_02205 [bacterium]
MAMEARKHLEISEIIVDLIADAVILIAQICKERRTIFIPTKISNHNHLTVQGLWQPPTCPWRRSTIAWKRYLLGFTSIMISIAGNQVESAINRSLDHADKSFISVNWRQSASQN